MAFCSFKGKARAAKPKDQRRRSLVVGVSWLSIVQGIDWMMDIEKNKTYRLTVQNTCDGYNKKREYSNH
jgi:hypothetical protein